MSTIATATPGDVSIRPSGQSRQSGAPRQTQPPTPATIAADSRLMQDYLLTDDILLDLGASTPVAVFQNAAGQNEALAVHADGLLHHVYRDAGSTSGWNLREVGGGMVVTEVVADRDADGTVSAVFANASGQLHAITQSADQTWSSPEDLGRMASNLGITGQYADDGSLAMLVAYGVSPAGNVLIMVRPAGDWWSPAEFADSLQGQTLQLLPSTNGPWALYTVTDGGLCYHACFGGGGDDYPGIWTILSDRIASAVPSNLARVITVPGAPSTLLVLGSDQLLWTVTVDLSSPDAVVFNPVTILKVTQACATRRSDDPSKLQVYALDTNARLWVIRQKDTGEFGYPLWYTPVPLGDNFACIATRPNDNTGAELFALDTGGALQHMLQDAATTRWSSPPLHQPAQGAAPQSVSRYHTVATICDSNNLPVPNAAVTISADSPTTAWIEGTSFPLTPGTPVSCQTNAMGKLNISCPAFGLHAPALTLTLASGATLTHNPAGPVHLFLAGQQPLNGMAPLDPAGNALLNATITDAQGNKTPLAASLNGNTQLAATAAQGIISAVSVTLAAAAARGSAAPGLKGAAPAPVGWAVSMRNPQKPVFITFATDQELQAYRTNWGGTAAPTGIWDDVANFMGDIWHAAENEVVTIVDWTIDAARNTVDFALQIENEIVKLFDVALHGIEDVISIVHSIFAAIGAALEEVIDWLKSVFAWHDIWNTKLVFEHLILGAIPGLQYLIEKRAVVDVQNFFSGLKGDVNNAFTFAQQYYQGKTFADIATPPSLSRALPAARVSSAGGAAGAKGATPTISPVDVMMQSTEAMWTWTSVFHYVPLGSGFDFDPPVDVSASVTKLTNALTAPLQDLQNAIDQSNLTTDLAKAYQSLKTFFDDVIKQPQGFNDKLVSDFLSAMNAFVNVALDLLDIIATVVLDLIDLMLQGFQQVLTAPLDIPVLSWLYKEIQSQYDSTQTPEDLTIVGLCALLLAAPATALYKTAQNQAPFSDEAVKEVLAWSFVAPGSQAHDPAARTAGSGQSLGGQSFLPPAVTIIGKVLYGVLSVPLAALDFFVDGLYDVNKNAPRDNKEDPSETILCWTDVGLGVLLQILSTPTDEDWFGNEAESWMDSVWIAGWVPPVISAALLFPKLQTNVKAQEWGKLALSIGGGALMGCGIAAAVEGMNADPPIQNRWDIAYAIFSPMGNAFQFLRLQAMIDSTETLSLWAKLILDPVGDLAAGVTQGPG